MKRTVTAYLFLAGIFFLSSCETEELIGTFNVSIDNIDHSGIGAANVGSNKMVISWMGQDRCIQIITNGTHTGNYSTMPFGAQYTYPFRYTPNLDAPHIAYIGISGTITVADMTDDRISGSFNVMASDTISDTIPLSGTFTNLLY